MKIDLIFVQIIYFPEEDIWFVHKIIYFPEENHLVCEHNILFILKNKILELVYKFIIFRKSSVLYVKLLFHYYYWCYLQRKETKKKPVCFAKIRHYTEDNISRQMRLLVKQLTTRPWCSTGLYGDCRSITTCTIAHQRTLFWAIRTQSTPQITSLYVP